MEYLHVLSRPMVIDHDHDIIWTEAYMDSVVSCLPFLIHSLVPFIDVNTVHNRSYCILSQNFILILFAFINHEPLVTSVILFQLPNTAEVNSQQIKKLSTPKCSSLCVLAIQFLEVPCQIQFSCKCFNLIKRLVEFQLFLLNFVGANFEKITTTTYKGRCVWLDNLASHAQETDIYSTKTLSFTVATVFCCLVEQ